MKFARDGKYATAHTQHPALREVMCWTFSKEHLRSRDQQKKPEKIKNKMKPMHQRDATQDHCAAHDQCSDDSPHQDAMLCPWRDTKVRENKHKNENVIHAQRIFDEVPGQEIQAMVWSLDSPHHSVKCKRHNHPQNAAPGSRGHA